MLRISAIILTLLSGNLIAQNLKWERVYGSREYEYGRSIIQCIDNGYAVAGTTSGYGPATDMYLIYLNNDGSFRWHKNFGGLNDEWAYSVKQTPSDSGFILCGFSNTWGGSGYDVYLVKTDKLGNLLWQKTYGGPDWDFGYSVALTSDGGYVIGGSTYSYGEGGEDAFMVKVDASGNLQWFNVYGGFEDDNAEEILQSSDGGYLFCGKTKSFTYGDYDMWIVKTTVTGDTTWTRHFGGTGEDALNCIVEASDGRFVAAGYTHSINGTADMMKISVTPAGALQDSVPEPNASRNDWIESITENNDGTFFTVGHLDQTPGGQRDFSYFKWFSNLYWVSPYAGSRGSIEDEMAYSCVQTADNGWIMAGNTESWGNGKTDLYIVKIDSIFQWVLPTVGMEPGPVSGELPFYPNPASGQFQFTVPAHKLNHGSTISITDLLGRIMFRQELFPSINHGQSQYIIPVAGLPDGSYLVTITDGVDFYAGKLLVNH